MPVVPAHIRAALAAMAAADQIDALDSYGLRCGSFEDFETMADARLFVETRDRLGPASFAVWPVPARMNDPTSCVVIGEDFATVLAEACAKIAASRPASGPLAFPLT